MNHRSYLALAIPLAISTLTTPLLGAVDTAVAGHLPDPAYIGGVAIGTLIFNTMYWLFGFLRVSTSGFAAQAHGADSDIQGILALARPLLLAILIGTSFIFLQGPIGQLSLQLINPEDDVRTVASEYFSIRIWGAPFTLLSYVILGWLIGMSMIKASLLLQLFMNLTNIILTLLFVNVFDWGTAGIAAATLLSEVIASAAGLIIVWKVSSFKWKIPPLKRITEAASLKKMMMVNRDLFIRTLCLLTVFNLFTAKGASFGTEVLAANAVLLQIHFIMAYFFDGFSNSSSILVGKAVGSRDEPLYKKTLMLSCQWAFLSALFIAGCYYLWSDYIVLLFTPMPSVIELAAAYQIWLILFPFSAGFGLILYGVFIGATETAPIRNSMILALVLYLLSHFFFVPSYHNHGLWFAFILFSLGRSVFLAVYIPKLNRTLFQKKMTENKNLKSI